jgi:hypothetical protein
MAHHVFSGPTAAESAIGLMADLIDCSFTFAGEIVVARKSSTGRFFQRATIGDCRYAQVIAVLVFQ